MPRNQTPAPMPTLDPADTNAPSPIGVPDDYVAAVPYTTDMPIYPRTGGSQGVLVTPHFYEGMEISFLFSLRPDALAQLQSQLSEAGLLDPDTYQPGFVGGASNDPTVQAISVVMSYANRSGFATVADALRSYTQSGYGAVGSQGYGGAQQEARLAAPASNPDDLRRVFRAAVIDTLGTGWSEGDIDAMVADYQAHERAYNSRVAAGEAVDEQLPTAETFAEQQAVAKDPAAAQGQDFLESANSLQSMLGRWNS